MVTCATTVHAMSKGKRGNEDNHDEIHSVFTLNHEISEEERLQKLFEKLDINHNGKIDICELSEALKGSKFGQQYAEVRIDPDIYVRLFRSVLCWPTFCVRPEKLVFRILIIIFTMRLYFYLSRFSSWNVRSHKKVDWPPKNQEFFEPKSFSAWRWSQCDVAQIIIFSG